MSESLFLPVGQAYDRWSPIYDSYRNPMVFMAAEIVRRSLLGMAPGADVFEFGCGTGRNLAAFEAAGARTVTGCDLSTGMLAEARRKSAGFRLFQHDMAHPLDPDLEQSADLVLFSLTLEHLADLRAPLAEARRILRRAPHDDHCRIAVIEIHPFLSLNGLAAHFDDGAAEVRMPAFPHQFADYLTAFRETGLEVIECREWSPAAVGNPEALQSASRAPHIPLTLEFQLQPRP